MVCLKSDVCVMCSCLKDCKQIDLVESNVNKRRETVLFDSTVRVPECSYLVRYHDSNRTKHIAMVMIWTFACICFRARIDQQRRARGRDRGCRNTHHDTRHNSRS